MTTPHAPHLRYLCDDYECCDNGCPDVRCRACNQPWPCPAWRSRHTERQVIAQYRYRFRKHYPGDERAVDSCIRLLKPADLT